MGSKVFYLPGDRAMLRNRDLVALLGGEVRRRRRDEPGGDGIWVGWGRKPSGILAMQMAARYGTGYLLLEDGFLRSIGFGPSSKSWSLVSDDLGIYYDARSPSRLEHLIQEPLSEGACNRARDMMFLWRENRVSKYNQAREDEGDLPPRYVLVVDQTAGDLSIRCGEADANDFTSMLEAALEENPGETIVLKIHPEVAAGKKRGHFDLARIQNIDRVLIFASDSHPVRFLECAKKVYTVTSQMGFEALLWGKLVRVFGMPFYAGWGITQDEKTPPSRRSPVPLESLVHAALIAYARYIDPETAKPCEPEHLIEWMGFQQRMRRRFPGRITACGFARWKHSSLKAFFAGSCVKIRWRPKRVDLGGTLALWPSRFHLPNPGDYSTILRVEDGFIRSVGLGSELVKPLSWVVDSRGIYYDAKSVSDLEHLLQCKNFPESLLLRARQLREKIVAQGTTKYNVDSDVWKRPLWAKKAILVVGQVESDASIRHGTTTIRTNMALLKAVQESNPQACVIYKPHPDVAAGLRRKGAAEENVHLWCNDVVTGCSLTKLFEMVDEVHVLTSLTGFEALLRGKPVFTYGQPFYAGWGLTSDSGLSREVSLRRTRVRDLDELVAATLILYPTYVSRTSGCFTTPERILDELADWKAQAPAAGALSILTSMRNFLGRVFAN